LGICERQVQIESTLEREHGMPDFSIIDNNGYEIVFGEDITSRKNYVN
jgi:hypothetical protein